MLSSLYQSDRVDTCNDPYQMCIRAVHSHRLDGSLVLSDGYSQYPPTGYIARKRNALLVLRLLKRIIAKFARMARAEQYARFVVYSVVSRK